MEWMAKLWRRLLDWLAPEQEPDLTPPRITVELRPFNWLEDYGPHWQPGSTAFWLEPRKESDLIAWLRRYRPEFQGEFEAAGLTVRVNAPLLSPMEKALANYGYGPQSAVWLQHQAHMAALQQNAAYRSYLNSLGPGLLQSGYRPDGILGFRLF